MKHSEDFPSHLQKEKKKKKTVAQHWASSPRVATRGANLGFQPRDVELGPKALPLLTSLAPGVHSEVRVHLLRTFDSHRFSRICRLLQGFKRDQSSLCHGVAQAQPPWVPWAHGSIHVSSAPLLRWPGPPRPAPPPSPKALPQAGLSQVSAPYTSPCSSHLRTTLPPGCSVPGSPPGPASGPSRLGLPDTSIRSGSYFVS